MSVTQNGDYGVAGGTRTAPIPTSGSYTLTVATGDDAADEADGSATATAQSGNGYTVSATNGAATVAVADAGNTALAQSGEVRISVTDARAREETEDSNEPNRRR